MFSLPEIISGRSYFAINIPNRYLGRSKGFEDPSCAILNIDCSNLDNFIASSFSPEIVLVSNREEENMEGIESPLTVK